MKEWPEVIIYQNDISPHCRTVLMVIKELGLNVTFREINLAKKEHLSGEFLKMNPLHTIPVMEERGYVLIDSHAISCYIIDDLSDYDYSLYPKDLQVRALVNQYLMIEAATLFPLVKHTIVPIMLGQKSSISKEMLDGCKEAYSYLDKLLEGKKWLVGKSYTLADISCVTVASSISVLLDVDQYPNVKAWIKSCEDEISSYNECNVPGLKKLHARLRAALPSS
ncbi:glutathione S-transferase 1-like isoform X3 [Bombus affinis]|uniref:glutathione S-transferase 1-like isoform X1 n=1 Tax=Bombus affinis TaxID=309941 RepID=UPI0021B83EC4|nr:glutathione S-transferase 1-like isoform X1 [Bombus affinis]XP_050582725.1 glutathione S-transferase 1-like isoform X3 [Bombus affinis]XP_050582728.1 glutathione S-transferase 1-like isoform X1 [Bombus affinis]XP_050582732.1 glutathione S-transferase 1-like isoform X3 [Bombus affinis]XP_050582733.1 glutathione S-transferase 1-like isoform X1 [Bombus affinis]XP_050582735.1 glutathione S-transferase 1-like isoform X1 [Bombus affinis]XP_050582736.1 glutathione S-transferase 1-like isoform X1 